MEAKVVELPRKGRKGSSENRATSKWQGLLVGLLFSFGSIVLALVSAEIVFRVLFVPPVIWRDRPGLYFIPENAKVLTDRTYSVTKSPGTIRIAVVGDSFSFAPYMQYDDAFAKRLERWLNLNENQPKVEVINYGVPRYSTTHEVGVVKRAIEEQADVILLQITLNDPEIKPYRPTGLLVEEGGEKPFSTGIYHYWRSLAYVRTRIENTRSHQDYIDYFFKLFEGQKTWANFVTPIKEIVKITSEKKVPLVATVFPLFGHPVNQAYPFFPLHKKVTDLLDSLSIKSLDLAEAYRDLPLDRLQVIPVIDRHPNEIGHRIAAEAIMEWLPSLQILPPTIFPKVVVKERIGIKLPESGAVEVVQ